MAMTPSRQFYPSTTSFIDSFHSSFSGSRLQFFRYNSTIYLQAHNFCAIHVSVTSHSTSPLKPPRKSFNLGFMSKTRPFSHSSPSIKLSTRNWIDHWNETHLQNRPKKPRPVLNYRNSGNFLGLAHASSDRDHSDSDGYGGISGGSTMDKIMERLKKVGYSDNVSEKKEKAPDRAIEKGSIEDIFYVEEGMLPDTRGGYSTESPLGGGDLFGNDGEVRFPWEKLKEEEQRRSNRGKRKTSLAEVTLPAPELSRLRYLGFNTKSKTRIGGGGVTQAVVDAIHEKWKTAEIARLKFEGSPALNMKRMHEILERKTGGLVIWRSGTSVILYRGSSYEVPVQLNKQAYSRKETPRRFTPTVADKTSRMPVKHDSHNDFKASQEKMEIRAEDKDLESVPEVRYEDEIEVLLDDLGPRYPDWAGDGPLPVDADMLPATIPGYQPPFRILPFGVRSTLGSKDITALRRLARTLPPHFALGRSRQLQGLAMAMIKLWDKSLIAKVALKRNVQLTTSERMAENLKKLTGGTLLCRNKDFLVFYRGKNFLSKDVSEALLERERLAKTLQDEEEQARSRALQFIEPNIGVADQPAIAGTLGETLDADGRWGKTLDANHKEKVMRDVERERHGRLVRKLEGKLAFAERKINKAERALSKVEAFLQPAERQADPDSITDEERFMFRKLGLRMKAFLLLGRRGVFDGTVENMHLHWKYRELIKIILKAKNLDQVKHIALALEAESGGVLVSVDKISKGFAIIVYRGKDYHRPSLIRPKNLLTKRKALARSIELQRREALYNHISRLQKNVETLRAEIEQMEIVDGQGDKEFYERLDTSYLTDNEESEDESGEEAYLETYRDGSEHEDYSGDSIHSLSKYKDHSDDDLNHNLHLVNNFPYEAKNQALRPQHDISDCEDEWVDTNHHQLQTDEVILGRSNEGAGQRA